ncbi:peptidoglycan hydrolase [Bacillus sp. AFS055030]|nr:peptidoglycan hydrolase [Bacillus sp. AFS055030]
MKVQFYADFTCPFSYIGKRLLDQVIEQSDEEIEFEFKSFQLTPEASTEVAIPTVEMLAKKFNKTKAEMLLRTAQIKNEANQFGLDYNYEIMKASNTLKAHRLTKWAASFGKARDITEAFFYGLFTEGANLNNEQELLQIVDSVGLNKEEAKKILDSDAFTKEVDSDRRDANTKGIHSVPTFIVDGQYIIQGLQPVNVFLQTFKKAAIK